ncbi:MAG: helix-turn-helix domain-containing protein [bacterium]|nr:helix-turn-helix domain-containing protein [bacterium]
MLQLEIIELFYLFSAFHGVLLISMLIAKRNLKTNIFLILLISFFTFYLIENVIYLTGLIREYPHLYFTSLPLVFLIGPLYYHYVKTNVDPNSKFKWIHITHLIPFLFELIILIPFYLLPTEIKIKVYENTLVDKEGLSWNIYFFGYLIYIVSSLIFFIASFKILVQAQIKTNKFNRKKKWLKSLSIFFIAYLLIGSTIGFIARVNSDLGDLALHFNLAVQMILIHILGYVAFLFPELLTQIVRDEPRYQYSSLNQGDINPLKEELLQLMIVSKPYLNSDLTPEDLARSLNVTKNNISQLLSTSLETNFYDFINQYRVNHAKSMLLDEKHKNSKIIHIALDSGFSNKSSFLRNFKKVTGTTPSNFKKSGATQLSETSH